MASRLRSPSVPFALAGLILTPLAALAIYKAWNKLQQQQRQNTEEEEFDVPKTTKIYLIETPEQCIEMFKTLKERFEEGEGGGGGGGRRRSEGLVFGMDAEWRPTSTTRDGMKRNKVALLQLATKELCFLIRLCSKPLQHNIPEELKAFLADPTILKVGVAISSDSKRLFSDHCLEVRGLVDLQALAYRYSNHGYVKNGTGLASLCKSILSLHMSKHHHIQCSDWEATPLSKAQVSYAACDAYVGYAIFMALYDRHSPSSSSSSPSLSSHSAPTSSEVSSETSSSSSSSYEDLPSPYSWCHSLDLIDRRGLPKPPSSSSSSSSSRKRSNDSEEGTGIPTRKTILYSNCKMLAPDGELLCTCDRKKVTWYLSRGIADLICEDPPTIKLKFQPGGRGHAGDDFFLAEKENRCVRCGRSDSFCRHSVVPSCYRTFFPEDIKSHNCHDILLLCSPCSRLAYEAIQRKKAEFAQRMSIPLGSIKYEVDRQLTKLKASARALKSKTSLPDHRRERLIITLQEHFQKEEITEEDILFASELETKKPSPDYVNHGKAVVEEILRKDTLQEFVTEWRRHFLEEMKPRFMPQHWSIDHPVFNRGKFGPPSANSSSSCSSSSSCAPIRE